MRRHDDHTADLPRDDGRRSGTRRGRFPAYARRCSLALTAPTPTTQNEETGLDWLARFRREHGRPLRVLHIGNIANNAYNNAKIQHRFGIDADVSCHEYYHVMACPEWEEAEFVGAVVDDFYPDWWNVDLGGFRRPEWFAQGSLRTSCRYLLARRRGQRRRLRLLRRQLTCQRWLRCRSTPTARVLGRSLPWAPVPFQAARRRLRATARALAAITRGEDLRVVAAIFLPQTLLPERFVRPLTEKRAGDLALAFRRHFPDRSDQLSQLDCRNYLQQVSAWTPLLAEYDVVQGYGTDPAVPMLCRIQAYAAYEHGTLRDIPFENSSRGRLCALSYREAYVVFLTNSDVLPTAERLGLDPERLVFLPHAVDSDRLFRFAEEHNHMRADAGAEVTVYSPTRHDWVDGDVSWSKGNDRFLRAAALLAERGHDFRLVLAEWGRDVEASKRLLAELNLGDRVTWIPTLRKRELWAQYLRSHAVIDQFTVPAIGGVTFEAMALGCRVITAIDHAETERFFGETPAVLAASEPEEIAEAMQTVIDDPADEKRLGQAARDWFARYHSAERIVELQAAAYRRLLE